ncbi:porin family protein [Spirosoma validum]|uniref:PorT family protein n=1 Tax=Spirosoma validum TaxID=2771355 RepID=A0A927GFD1_9BACT|nr:porin family protein [Spirosoma validum]MBD2755782.1 PorT family protein [Spirosoma validum]
MKVLLSLLTLSLVSQGLLAQSRPAARKPTSANRSEATRTASTPARKPAPVAQYTAPQPAPAAPAPQQQPGQEPQATAYVTPGAQATPTTRPTRYAAPARVDKGGFRIGFRLGANSSTIGGFDPASFGEGVKAARPIGFHGGVIFNFGGPNFSVQPEILYTQYGIKMTAGSEFWQLKYNFIEVPILFKASFGQPSLRYFVNAGPVASYTMGGTESFQFSGQSGSQTIDMTGSGRMSFGISGGGGIALQAGPGAVQVEARYAYLFSSAENGVKLNPQNAMLSVGYLIPLGGR